MFARKIRAEILEPAGPKPCPIAWLDSFCMRSFTGHSAFDETLPVAEGEMEAGFRVDLEALRVDVEGWLTRKFGAGKAVRVRLVERETSALPTGKVHSPAVSRPRSRAQPADSATPP